MPMADIEFMTLTGKDILPFVDDLAHLRIVVFKEYPYLYDGDIEYERGYLKRFIENPDAMMIVAKDITSQKIVGVSTGAPLISEMNEAKQPFIEKKYSLAEIFYFSESVLLPAYRGQGIGRYFLQEREKMARCNQNITSIAFCAVEREANHPKKPKDYHSLEMLWQKAGFEKHPDLFTYYSWQDLGEKIQTKKQMVFWMKTL